MEDLVNSCFTPIFPDFWSTPSYSLKDLFSPHHPEVLGTSEIKGEVWRFLSSEEWKSPLAILPKIFPSDPERVLIEGTAEGFFLNGEKVTQDLLKAIASHLGVSTEGYHEKYFHQALQTDLIKALQEQLRFVLFVCHMHNSSSWEMRGDLWETAFHLERHLPLHAYGTFPTTIFKVIEDYPEEEHPYCTDLCKYLVHRVRSNWSWGELREVLSKMFPTKVKNGMSFRRAMESLFKGKVKIPKDLRGWDTPRILKELKRHGYLEE